MEAAIFHLIEGTNDWQYKDFKLTELKKTSQWKLMTGTTSILFDSIYDAISDLGERGYNSTFKAPPEVDDIPPKCC